MDIIGKILMAWLGGTFLFAVGYSLVLQRSERKARKKPVIGELPGR